MNIAVDVFFFLLFCRLLVYMSILANQKHNKDLTKKTLEIEIENWIRSKTNTHITFNSDQSIEFLRKLGI